MILLIALASWMFIAALIVGLCYAAKLGDVQQMEHRRTPFPQDQDKYSEICAWPEQLASQGDLLTGPAQAA